jgi:hypothetical protein
MSSGSLGSRVLLCRRRSYYPEGQSSLSIEICKPHLMCAFVPNGVLKTPVRIPNLVVGHLNRPLRGALNGAYRSRNVELHPRQTDTYLGEEER